MNSRKIDDLKVAPDKSGTRFLPSLTGQVKRLLILLE